MINFKKLDIEGFASIVKPLSFKLDLGPTLSIIRGNVGSGKTTLASALCWALYGKTLKDKSTVEPWASVRSDIYRGTKVSVEFEKDGNNYQIIKCKSFKGKVTVGKNLKTKGGNNVFILLNGEILKDKDIKGLTASHNHIAKVVGYSFDLFKNSIMFGQKMKRIIEETGPNKKKVFDEAFEMVFIDEAKKNEESERNKLNDTYFGFKNELDKVVDKIDDKQELYESALSNEENFDKQNKSRKKELGENIRETKVDIEYWQKELSSISVKNNDKIVSEIKEIKTKIEKIEHNNNQYQALIEEIEDCERGIAKHQLTLNKKPKLCPTCSMPLSDKGYSNMVASAKAAIGILNANIVDYKKRLKLMKPAKDTSKLNSKLEELKKHKIILDNSKSKKAEIESKLINLEKRLKGYEKELGEVNSKKVEIKSPKYLKDVKKLKKKQKRLNTEIKRLDEQLKLKDWLISEPLSNNGLKAYLFDELLQQVNAKLDEYATILGFQVEFGIDLESHRKDFYQLIMKENEVIPYEDLSGGQKQLVDTAVALAINTVIAEIRPTNFLFMDEPFESLGIDEVEVVAELIQEKAKESSVFLITHHSMFSPVNVNEISVKLDEDGHTIII